MIPDTLQLSPCILQGTAAPPPSKSAAHRAIICASLAKGQSLLRPAVPSRDMDATIGAMRNLGARIERLPENTLSVEGSSLFAAGPVELDCGESGSTLRFLIPVAAAGGVDAVLAGHGRLPQRPLGPYLELLPAHGCACKSPDGASLPLRLTGQLTPGRFSLRGDISSQFITGLLLALPLLEGDSDIVLLSPLESAGYIELTLDILRAFGITAEKTGGGFHIPGGQHYRSRIFEVERDWSQAAFWLAAGALGGPVSCMGMNLLSAQGDREIVSLLRRFGARVKEQDGVATCFPAPLHGINIDASQVPDLVPVLAVLGALAQGQTHIFNAARLRLKESDRLRAMAVTLGTLGARVREEPDGLVIEGAETLPGGEAEGFNDHRVVMALAIAALRCRDGVLLHGCGSVKKSYPTFFNEYRALGGVANVIHMG